MTYIKIFFYSFIIITCYCFSSEIENKVSLKSLIELYNKQESNKDFSPDLLEKFFSLYRITTDINKRSIISYYIGKIYFLDKSQNKELALNYFTESYVDTKDPKIKIETAFYIGKVFIKGRLFRPEYRLAVLFFPESLNQDQDLFIKFKSAYYLGQIYYLGPGIIKDHKLAKKYFKIAYNQDKYLDIKDMSEFYLEKLDKN